MISRGTKAFQDRFDRAHEYSATPGVNGWAIKDTSSSGTPTYANTVDGAVLTLAATSEAEIVTLYQKDILIWRLRDLISLDFIVKVSGIDAATTLVFGLATAQNDTPDSVAGNLWFRLEGSGSTSAVLLESDDALTDNDDKATGQSLGSTFKKFSFNFDRGIGDVLAYIDGVRVGSGVSLNLGNVSASQGVQPFVQLQKASGTGVPSVVIREVSAQYRYAVGA